MTGLVLTSSSKQTETTSRAYLWTIAWWITWHLKAITLTKTKKSLIWDFWRSCYLAFSLRQGKVKWCWSEVRVRLDLINQKCPSNTSNSKARFFLLAMAPEGTLGDIVFPFCPHIPVQGPDIICPTALAQTVKLSRGNGKKHINAKYYCTEIWCFINIYWSIIILKL